MMVKFFYGFIVRYFHMKQDAGLVVTSLLWCKFDL